MVILVLLSFCCYPLVFKFSPVCCWDCCAVFTVECFRASPRSLWLWLDSQSRWKGQEVEFTFISDREPQRGVPGRTLTGLLKEFGLAGQWLCSNKEELAIAPLWVRFSIISKPEWLEVNLLVNSDKIKSISDWIKYVHLILSVLYSVIPRMLRHTDFLWV